MNLVQFDTSGIKYLDGAGCWFGVIDMTIRPEGSKVAHNVQVKIRTQGNLSQSYQEAEAAIQAEAVSVLSRAIELLGQNTHEELQTMLGK